MYEEFVKEISIPNISEEDCDKEIILSILEAKSELLKAHNNFEYAEDELIDYYTYKIKSEQAKIDYLLKKAKNKKLVLTSTEVRTLYKDLNLNYSNI